MPFIAGLMGKKIPVLTWCAAVAALCGVGLLETTGAPPSVRHIFLGDTILSLLMMTHPYENCLQLGLYFSILISLHLGGRWVMLGAY